MSPAVGAQPPRLSGEDLGALLAGGGVVPAFQPIVDLARASVVGYEALARFEHVVRSPVAWFEVARREGRLAELEALTLSAALAGHEILPRNTFLTVNISPAALTAPPVAEVWDQHPDLRGVVVELTEHDPIDSYAAIEPALDQLRGAGAMLAIDDAGAGYAGLQHMLSLRPDIIKLDRGLVSDVHRHEAKRVLVEMIGTLAGRLDAWLLAEGIETGDELDVLLQLGVPLAQGYYLGRPGPPFPAAEVESVHRILTQADRGRDGGLRALLEQAPAARDGEHAARILGSTLTDIVVVIDEHDSPVAVMAADSLLHPVRQALLRVNIASTVEETVRRAMVRDRQHRFSPVACTDDAGRYLGVVRMERLVDRLLTTGVGTSVPG